MYVLTIVFLVSQVVVVSDHASQADCEQIARRALAVKVGPQAVQSATCTPIAPKG